MLQILDLDRNILVEGDFIDIKSLVEDAVRENINLRNVDLSKIDLRNVNLYKVDLSGASFEGSMLDGADFNGADLFKVNFQKAKLNRADFTDAYLGGADFEGADLTNTTFYDADLSNASFINAKLDEAILDEASMLNTNFKNASLKGAFMRDIVFSLYADFTNANLEMAYLNNSDFTTANLDGATMNNITVDKTEFSLKNILDAKNPEKIKTSYLSEDCIMVDTNKSDIIKYAELIVGQRLKEVNGFGYDDEDTYMDGDISPNYFISIEPIELKDSTETVLLGYYLTMNHGEVSLCVETQ